ncbi:MAG: DAK2 domain-containing protein [Clostridia bacterium]|nr:DAK2 domain-containing protein [Clostridia bacterium]
MKTVSLDGRLFARMAEGGAARLYERRGTVNELNVFPIPDGDTGDNMYMTLDAGCRAVPPDEGSLGKAAGRLASGMLMGARGNSGVILSRIFAGISAGLEGLETADVAAFSQAMERGVKEAYGAVQTPVEGTILTVYADSVAAARAGEDDFEDYFDKLENEMRSSLERTPDLLPVLKEAGVVDSGGAGLVYIAEGMREALAGGEFSLGDGSIQASSGQKADLSLFTEDSPFEFGYCTELLLRLRTDKVGDPAGFDEAPLGQWLNSHGDSVVFFRDGSILKAHVHTMRPEDVLAEFHKYGEFLTLKIENMCLQHSEAVSRGSYAPKKARKKFGIIAVAAGSGIRKTFMELGADAVVDGGQSMNPPASDFLKAFNEVNAENILVFPNNSNIILTAKQAAGLYSGSNVRVIESRSIGDCYAALSLLDLSSGDIDEIERGALEVMESIRTGMVSRASRDAQMDGVAVRRDSFRGFCAGKVLCCRPTPEEAALELARALGADGYGILMLVAGVGADTGRAQDAARGLAEAYPMTEVIPLDGGQPVYDYIMILE